MRSCKGSKGRLWVKKVITVEEGDKRESEGRLTAKGNKGDDSITKQEGRRKKASRIQDALKAGGGRKH